MDNGIKSKRSEHPRANANIFEIVTFSWLSNLFKKGRQKDLEINDLYTNLDEHTSMTLGDSLEEKWKQEIANAIAANRRPSLLRAIFKTFGKKIILLGLLLSFGDIILKMSQPVMIGGLLSYFNPETSKHTDLAHTYMYAVGLTISMLGSTVLFHSVSLEMSHFGMKIRVACCSTIFRKTLCLSKIALGQAGQVVNLLSNDVNRFDSALFLLHYLWISPLQTLVVTYFLWQEIGVASILGLSALIVFIPLQGWLGKKSSEFRLKTAIRTDERVRLMNEIISGIQVIKMYTWEKPFAFLVQCARRLEINQIKGSSYIKGILVSYTAFHTRIALSFSIFAYVFLGHKISAQKVFIIASYYNLIRASMSILFPQSIATTAEVLVTIKRIQDFLLIEEKGSNVTNNSKSDGEVVNNGAEKVIYTNGDSSIILNNVSKPQSDDFGIIITNATAKWTDVKIDNTLENINLTVKPGRLAAIIGPVGAGKSSLIQAVLRELPLSEGNISVHGVISYAAQEPWLFASSVQQNILFGLPMDAERYEQVIQVCALKTDFKQLSYGDRTIVGEKGVSLSGGQRARINLARAIYKQADIYLLDDPLSAVDAHVGRHLFEKCIQGFLREKICILITHQVQYLNNVDQIVLMENGNILMEGTYNEIQASNLDFAKLLLSSIDLSNEADNESKNKNNVDSNINFNHRASVRSVTSTNGTNKICEDQQKPMEVFEKRSSGNISCRVYLTYLFAGGSECKIVFFILICLLTQFFISSGDIWITHWVNLEDHIFSNMKKVSTSTSDSTFIDWWSMSRENCCLIYAFLISTIIMTAVIRSATFVSVCMTASTTLHDNMFNALSRATIYFFNTNSSGRILNRFSKDMGSIDEVLPVTMMDCIHSCLTLLGIVVVIGTVNIYLMTPIFILAFIFYKISNIYLSTSRGIKRLEGITRSPIYAHLNSTMQGLTTIRAFKAEKVLSSEFEYHQDLHSSTWYLFMTSSRAFGFWLDLICLTYITIVTFSFIAFTNNGTFGGNVGLAITQAFGLVGMFQWGIRQAAELENNMTSVERVIDYINAPQEAPLESPLDKTLALKWPSRGQITFKHFYLRYGQDSKNVLHDLNVNIESMHKVGIVGRTGAGKSSIIAALFRLAINEGSIFIDGIDIHELGLHKLRSSISIIPQEPILFSGKLRTNLDPFDEYSDHTLWNALDQVELKGVVEDLPHGLNSKMSEGGSNFSLGQRQLVCLARAIVRNNKILVLDEATANVDPQTDALIQRTIRNKFRTSTVLTIAHRLNTVMDSDKIIVMDAGKIVEFDHPYDLLKNKEGFLYKMVEQTGSATVDMLHKVAAESYYSFSQNINHEE